MRLSVRGKRSEDARCAFCHDDLVGVIDGCPRCHVAFHRDCGAHLKVCPSLGCGTELHVPSEEAPAAPDRSLGATILQDRMLAFLVLVASLAAAYGLREVRWTAETLVPAALVATTLLWSAWTLGRDVPFLLGLRSLRRQPGVTVVGHVRVERREDDRLHFLELTGESLRLTVDLNPSLTDAPKWLTRFRAGAPLIVRGTGPVVIECPRTGRVYAVPAHRVSGGASGSGPAGGPRNSP